MSDPVTNAEIEDVLSSIRRLVSTDSRDGSDVPKAAANERNKLVLTPSQRVDDARGENDPVGPGQSESLPVEAAFLAQYAVEPDSESDVPQFDDEPLVGDEDAESDLTKNDGETPEFKHHREDADAALELDEPEDSASETEAADDGPEFAKVDIVTEAEQHAGSVPAEATEIAHDSSDLQAKIASVEAALAGRDDEWEPDGDEDDAYGGEADTPLEWEDHSEDQAKPVAGETGFDAAYDDGFYPETEDVSDDAAPSASEQDDHLNEAESVAATEPDDAWELQGDILDEEALRDMVSEIVRQELQGALGERITRNVRKLVRREIHRALASQDFE